VEESVESGNIHFRLQRERREKGKKKSVTMSTGEMKSLKINISNEAKATGQDSFLALPCWL